MIYYFFLFSSLTIASLEAVSYLGFFLKHAGVSPYLIYFIAMLSILTLKKSPPWLIRLLSVLAIVLTGMLVVVSYLEMSHYPNYIYSHLHLNILSFHFLLALTVLHLSALKRFALPLPLRVSYGLLLGIVVSLLAGGFGRTVSFAIKGSSAVMIAPFASYEQKMRKTYPGLYPALKEVVRLTQEDATILIPPQANPWEFEGNAAIVTYFVYPRKVMSLPMTGVIPEGIGPTYVLIARGSWPNLITSVEYGWPKFPVRARKIWDFNHGKTLEYSRDYNPTTDAWDWGLIEVKYD